MIIKDGALRFQMEQSRSSRLSKNWFSLGWLLIGALFAIAFGVYLLAHTPLGPMRIFIGSRINWLIK
jgi:hypothetical protein